MLSEVKADLDGPVVPMPLPELDDPDEPPAEPLLDGLAPLPVFVPSSVFWPQAASDSAAARATLANTTGCFLDVYIHLSLSKL